MNGYSFSYDIESLNPNCPQVVFLASAISPELARSGGLFERDAKRFQQMVCDLWLVGQASRDS